MSLWDEEPSVVVTFDNTADASAAAEAGRVYGMPGRLISIPSMLTAGCGRAWCAPVAEKGALLTALSCYRLAHASIYELSGDDVRRIATASW